MKKIFLILYLFISITTFSLSNWEIIDLDDSISPSTIYFDSDNIYLGTHNGIYYSNNNCSIWSYLGLQNYHVRAICVSSDNELIAGANETIFKYLSNNEWQLLFINGNVQNVICLYESDSGYLFDGTWEGIYRSTDFSETWIKVLDLINSEIIKDISGNSQGILFAGSNCYAGGNYPGGVYRFEDGGENWELIGLDYNFVSSLEINSYDSIFVGTRGHWYSGSGGVFISSNNGNSWQVKYDNNLVTSMCIKDYNTVFIGCSTLDWARGGVYQSFNNGDIWEDISEGLDNRNIKKVYQNPQDYLYAISYSPLNLYRSINPITKISNYLYNKKNDITFYPNPAKDIIYIESIIENYSGKYKIFITDISGRIVKSLHPLIDNNTIELDISDLKSAMYFVNTLYNNKQASFKFIKH